MTNTVTCCTVNQKLYNEGTHLNWRVQPAGFAPPEVSGERWCRTGTSVCTQGVAESSWEISGLFWLLQWAKQWKNSCGFDLLRGCSSSLFHNSVISYLHKLVRTAASMQVPSCVHGSVDKIHSYSWSHAGVELQMTILSLCFPCPISGSNISFECCCFSWNLRLLHLAGLLILQDTGGGGCCCSDARRTPFNWLYLKRDLFLID